MNASPDASLFRWRKDSTTGETNDLVTDADVLRRAAAIVTTRGALLRTAFLAEDLRWLAFRLESEPSCAECGQRLHAPVHDESGWGEHEIGLGHSFVSEPSTDGDMTQP